MAALRHGIVILLVATGVVASPAAAVGQTNVSGPITANTTWSRAGSPYIVVGDTAVVSGVTLTIQEGVSIEFTGAFTLLIRGVVIAQGTESARISFSATNAAAVAGATMLKFEGADLNASQLRYLTMSGAAQGLMVGRGGGEGNPGLPCTGTLTVSNSSFTNTEVSTAGYMTTARLVLDRATISSARVIGHYPRSEPIAIRQSRVQGSTITVDSYNYGIEVEQSTVTGSTVRVGCCSAALTIRSSEIIGSTISQTHQTSVDGPLTIVDSIFAGSSISIPNVRFSITRAVFGNTPVIVGSGSVSASNFAGSGTGFGLGITGFNGYTIQGENSITGSTFNGFDTALQFSGARAATVTNNNFFDTARYALANRTPTTNIVATSNYWGVTTPAAIAEKVYDFFDDINVGTVDASNPLMQPSATAPLPAPSGLRATFGANEVRLQWNAGRSDVLGYRVHYGPQSGYPYAAVVDVGNVTSYTVTGAGAFARYFAVTAYDSEADRVRDFIEGHESWFSNEVQEVPTLMPTTATVGSGAGSGTIQLSFASAAPVWTAVPDASWVTVTPTSGTGSATITYNYQANSSSATRSTTITIAGQTFTLNQSGQSGGVSVSPTSWNAPANGGTLNVTLTAPSGAAWSASSDGTWLTVSPASGVGNATLRLTAAANTSATTRTARMTVGGQMVTVTQAAPVNCSFTVVPSAIVVGLAARTGTIQLTTGNSCTWTASSSDAWLLVTPANGTGSAQLTYAVTRNTAVAARSGMLMVGTAAVAVTQEGEGGAAQPPGEPLQFAARVAGFEVTFSWQPPLTGGLPVEYVLEVGSGPGLSNFGTYPTGSDALTFSVSGAPAGTYTVRLRARNARGLGSPSNEIQIVVGPGGGETPNAPTSLAGELTLGNLTLTWRAPTTGAVPTSYLVEAGTAVGRADIGSVTTGSTLTRFEYSGVPAGRYFFRVRAVNAVGVSAASNEIELSTGVVMPPGAPTNLQRTVSGSTVTLTWSASSSGGAATSYVIEAGTASGRTDIASVPTLSTSTSTSFSGVPVGRYVVRVRALNSGGISAPSNEVTIDIAAAAAAADQTSPVAPQILVSGRSIDVSWPHDVSASSYTLFFERVYSAEAWSVEVATSRTSQSFEAPAAGVYRVAVRVNRADGGVSALSPSATFEVRN